MHRIALGAGLLVLASSALAQQRPNPLKLAPSPTSGSITREDLMTRVYIFADDSMMGRQTGTVHHDKGTNYIARELARLGLRPGGDSGTYFQRLPIVNRNLTARTRLVVDGREFKPGRDFLLRDAVDFGMRGKPLRDVPAVYGGAFGEAGGMIPPSDVADRVVVFSVPRGWQANRGPLTERYIGAAAIVIASLDSMPAETREELSQPATTMSGMTPRGEVPDYYYVSRAVAEAMLGAPLASATNGAAGRTVSATVEYAESPAPGARNVIAMLPGSDPRLRGQYVAIGAHSDHDGVGAVVDHDSLYAFYHVVRPNGADDGDKPATAEDLPKIRALLDSLRRARSARRDSIYNGADDDASGSMGLLEVAEAFATAREQPKRSILFIWHVAEEQGMVGSRYFTDNPTVPRDSIVANINIDMIGRGGAADVAGGGPGYLQLIGARRLSTELGDIVEAEGRKFNPPFRFDYQFDANGHPQQFYCRSDHYMYARFGIPVVFMSTGGHAEYHQVTDEPQYLDYDQLARVSQLVFNTARTVADLDHRLVVDKPKPDPNGRCVQ
jgi:hypothetical protein